LGADLSHTSFQTCITKYLTNTAELTDAQDKLGTDKKGVTPATKLFKDIEDKRKAFDGI
jgi:hypothetical protein